MFTIASPNIKTPAATHLSLGTPDALSGDSRGMCLIDAISRRPSLLSLLLTGKQSLIAFDPAEIRIAEHLLASNRQDSQLRKELKLALHTGLSALLGLREVGLPILDEQARFLHPVEGHFVRKKLAEDLLFCSPDLPDENMMASHIQEEFVKACGTHGASIRENAAHLDLIYLIALELLPKQYDLSVRAPSLCSLADRPWR